MMTALHLAPGEPADFLAADLLAADCLALQRPAGQNPLAALYERHSLID